MIWRAISFAAAASGFLIACYFTLVQYRILPADAKFVPWFCRLGEQTCLSVLTHPDAHLLRVPNSVLGGAYYVLAAMSAAGLFGPQVRRMTIYASWAAAGVSAYLASSLMFRIRTGCPLCMAAHTINLALAVLLTTSETGS
jgi:uncharacterized membrane protein